MILAKEQRIGIGILLGIAMVAWFAVAFWPADEPVLPAPPSPKRSWEQRKDSIRRADSIRYAQWAAEREQRYDSFRIADSLRRIELKQALKQRRDSMRRADSIWRDSIGIPFIPRVKKDTILDLNHCDTAELQLIRGIGRYTAVQIVQYRERLGGFYSAEQLTDEVFGNLSLDTLLHHFIVDTTAIRTIPVNTASAERMQRHPYIRYSQAKAIYALRRKKVRLRSMDDLRSLPELSEEEYRKIAPYLSFE